MYSRGILALFASLAVFGLQVSSLPLQRVSENDLVARTSYSAIDEVLLARAILAELSLATRDIDDDFLAIRSLERLERRSPAGDGKPPTSKAIAKVTNLFKKKKKSGDAPKSGGPSKDTSKEVGQQLVDANIMSKPKSEGASTSAPLTGKSKELAEQLTDTGLY